MKDRIIEVLETSPSKPSLPLSQEKINDMFECSDDFREIVMELVNKELLT